MSFSWLKQWIKSKFPARGRKTRRIKHQHRRGVRLGVEALEDRTLLSDVSNTAALLQLVGSGIGAGAEAQAAYNAFTGTPSNVAAGLQHSAYAAGNLMNATGSMLDYIGAPGGTSAHLAGDSTQLMGALGHLGYLQLTGGTNTEKLNDAIDAASDLTAVAGDVTALFNGQIPPVVSDSLASLHDGIDFLHDGLVHGWTDPLTLGDLTSLAGDIVGLIGDALGGALSKQPLQVSVDPPAGGPYSDIMAAGFNFIDPVASFSDPNVLPTPLPASSYTAIINWGDGTSSTGQIVQDYAGASDYTVIGSHTYAGSGDYPISVTVTGDGTSGSEKADGNVLPAIEPLSIVPTGGPAAIVLGQTFNDTLLTFQTNASESQNLQSYTAVINWGDGSSSAGRVVYPHGGFGHVQVAGNHLYTKAGDYSVGVQVTGPDGSSISGDSSVIVNPSGIIAQASNDAPTGLNFNGTLAHFTDTDGDSNPNDFSAIIFWGDGKNPSMTTGQIVADGQGGFKVVAARQFPQYGLYLPEVRIVDNTDGSAADFNSSLAVGGPTVSANNISAVAGQMFSATVGTFTWPDASASASNFSVSIDWGDDDSELNLHANPQPPQLIANGNGSFSIVGSHVYGGAGTFAVQVSVQPLNDSAPLQTDSTATVGASGLKVTAGKLTISPSPSANSSTAGVAIAAATSGGSVNGSVATLTLPPGASASDYTAIINWGDGNTSTGQIVANSNGTFNVIGSHTYSQIDGYLTSVQVIDSNGKIASAFGTVSPPPPTSSVNPLPSTETSPTFTVSWSGSDPNGPGIASYNVYVSDNGGAFTPWLTNTTQTSATYTGQNGHTYGFYSVATDALGLTQPTPTAAQATTTVKVVNSVPPPVIIGNPANQNVTDVQTATFTASANGAQTVQWQVSTDGGRTWSNISGANSTTLTLNNLSLAMNGYVYRAVFSNSAGSSASNAATLSVSVYTPASPMQLLDAIFIDYYAEVFQSNPAALSFLNSFSESLLGEPLPPMVDLMPTLDADYAALVDLLLRL